MLLRNNLPQIPKKEFDNFRKYAAENGIISSIIRMPILSLIPIQKHLKKSKIKEILDSPDVNSPPIIVSNDNHIIDGHHRWAADAIYNKEQKIVCVKFACSTDDLIELGHKFDKSTIKSI